MTVQAVVLLGHSTGCQDAVRYCKVIQEDAGTAAPLAGVILQAPVCTSPENVYYCQTPVWI